MYQAIPLLIVAAGGTGIPHSAPKELVIATPLKCPTGTHQRLTRQAWWNRVQPDMKDRCAERYLYTLDWILRLGLWADNAATWAHKSVSRLRTTGSSRQCGMGSSPIDTSTFPIRCFWRAELNGFIHTWFDPHCKGWSDLTCTRLPHPPSTLGANGSSAKPVSSCSGINNQGCRTLAGPSALRTGTEGASKDLEVER